MICQEQQRLVRPHSKLAQDRTRLACYQKRQKRREALVSQAERRLKRQQNEWQTWQNEMDLLRQRLDQFEQDNQANTTPIQVIFRLDAGFGTVENMAEMITVTNDTYITAESVCALGYVKKIV